MSKTTIRPALTMSKLLESMDRLTAIRFLESIEFESRPESVWLKAWDEEAERHERT